MYKKKGRDIISRLQDICILLGSSYTHKWEASTFNLKRPFLIKIRLGSLSKLAPTATLNSQLLARAKPQFLKCKELKILEQASLLSPNSA